ncbi:MAG: UDP-N-acetylmuramoyl-tripeptide--D-alanyl-D-alanine ligase [Oscillospiraceae bacterium]|nr:UDP-N-acetylmuramoyl-tripeptide--D-alanyl-D-alanine ligase [Oscillospiraceae bacterium]
MVFCHIAACVCLLIWAAGSLFAALHWMHLLQLQSYRAHELWRRLVGAPLKLAGGLLPALAALPFAVFATEGEGSLWLWAVCALLFALSAVILRPRRKNVKKPLVFTGRVKRLTAVYGLLLLACLALSVLFYLRGGRWLLPVSLALLFSLFLAILANWICAPVERAVKRWYTNDAIKKLRGSTGLLTLGVTGSYGKTSVKTYLGALLGVQYDTLITPESFNTPMGVVRTVREHLRTTHEVFVCEMGARHVGDIKELCDLVHPQHGLITAIGNQHLETFHTQENIVHTKYELADALPPEGKLFLNGDCDLIRENLPSRPYITYGLGEGNDYRATDVELSLTGTSFTVSAPDGESYRYRMPLIGGHSVLNVTGAIAVCHTFGIPLASLAPAVRKLAAVPHRMQLRAGEITYIDDAYNSNPAGCRAALETLGRFDACRILVTPGMVELGADMERCNEEFGAQAAEVCDLCVLVGEKQAVPIKRGLLNAGYPEERIRVVRTLQEALAEVNAFRSEKRKVVLLENDLPDQY